MVYRRGARAGKPGLLTVWEYLPLGLKGCVGVVRPDGRGAHDEDNGDDQAGRRCHELDEQHGGG